jgi:hypothetical protein
MIIMLRMFDACGEKHLPSPSDDRAAIKASFLKVMLDRGARTVRPRRAEATAGPGNRRRNWPTLGVLNKIDAPLLTSPFIGLLDDAQQRLTSTARRAGRAARLVKNGPSRLGFHPRVTLISNARLRSAPKIR